GKQSVEARLRSNLYEERLVNTARARRENAADHRTADDGPLLAIEGSDVVDRPLNPRASTRSARCDICEGSLVAAETRIGIRNVYLCIQADRPDGGLDRSVPIIIDWGVRSSLVL